MRELGIDLNGQRVGLVLGGGGLVGLAYHAGVLAALEVDARWDPRHAEVIVATSAGAIVATLLRRGVPAHDLAAVLVGAPVIDSHPSLGEHVRSLRSLPPLSVRQYLRRPRMPNLSLVSRWMRRPWRVDPLGALATIVPDGELDMFHYAELLNEWLDTTWPAEQLWLTAVRQRDLRRVVFGRDAHAPLATAVAASCAVPGYFRPVVVDDERYVDGGVCSPTNADVLRSYDGLDLIIVVSPMSASTSASSGIAAAVRRVAGARAHREVEALRAEGMPVLLIEPSAELVPTLGRDFLSAEGLVEITREAFFDTGLQLARDARMSTMRAGGA